MENPLSLKGKITGQTPNNFTIIKSNTIIFVYISRLNKNLSHFSLFSHTLIISFSFFSHCAAPFLFLMQHTPLFFFFTISLYLWNTHPKLYIKALAIACHSPNYIRSRSFIHVDHFHLFFIEIGFLCACIPNWAGLLVQPCTSTKIT